MIPSPADWVFWIAVVLVGYSYVGYPLILAFLARLAARKPVEHRITRPSEQPAVACIIAAYNEEFHIAERIDNILAQNYPPDKLTIYVGSDGSRDGTAAILSSRSSRRVRTFAFENNRGKATVLNELVAASSEPVLVFSDANTMFAPDVVARLVARLDDHRVGAVCGELRLLDANGANHDSAYWRIEQMLKRSEAAIGGLLGANGAIYALRRTLYEPIPADTIIDDFCIAMTAAAKGAKLTYAPDAIATEDTPDDIADEYRRRVRIGIGNYQALFRHPEYLTRTNWATSFAYVSHKVLRWFTPHLMILALAASAILAPGSPVYLGLLLLQLAAYAAALLVWRFDLERALPRPLAMLYMFLTLNWAFLVAFMRYVTVRSSGTWHPTKRRFERSDTSEA